MAAEPGMGASGETMVQFAESGADAGWEAGE